MTTRAKHSKIQGQPQRVLNALCFAPLPNKAFNGDADMPHRFGHALWAPVNSALGFLQALQVAMSSGEVLFFENFYVRLVWQRSACVNGLSAQGCMFVIHGILMRPGTALISIEFRNVVQVHGSI
jgi:hypothetical protein